MSPFFRIYVLLLYFLACLATSIIVVHGIVNAAECEQTLKAADQVVTDCQAAVNKQAEIIDAQIEVIGAQDEAIAAKDTEIERLDEPATKWWFGLSGSTLTLLLVILL